MCKSIVVGMKEGKLRPCGVLVPAGSDFYERVKKHDSRPFRGIDDALCYVTRFVKRSSEDLEIYGAWENDQVADLVKLSLMNGVRVQVPKGYTFLSPFKQSRSLRQIVLETSESEGYGVRVCENLNYHLFTPINGLNRQI